jgi:hypothetical protein
MDNLYVFKDIPAPIKRLIYVYLIGLGTPTSKLIKDEYELLYQTNKNHLIVNDHMSYYIDRDIGFMGFKMCIRKFFQRTVVCGDTYYEEPIHIYEVDAAKLFYLYNYSNADKFNIIHMLRTDNLKLAQLVKYKLSQLTLTHHGIL